MESLLLLSLWLTSIEGMWAEIVCNSPYADAACRIAATPPFTGLRRFPEGRKFKQWTGDDSKALMKVCSKFYWNILQLIMGGKTFIPAVAGYIPPKMLLALSTFMDFCYLVRRPKITSQRLLDIEDALERFQDAHTIFAETGVRFDGFCLPRQHALNHYPRAIQLFGAPNGLCSSITESKHLGEEGHGWQVRLMRVHVVSDMLIQNDIHRHTSPFCFESFLEMYPTALL